VLKHGIGISSVRGWRMDWFKRLFGAFLFVNPFPLFFPFLIKILIFKLEIRKKSPLPESSRL
jgi:hypothetical protein